MCREVDAIRETTDRVKLERDEKRANFSISIPVAVQEFEESFSK